MIDVSALDIAPVWSGDGVADAIRRVGDLAAAVEDWGYARFWIGEHHNTPALAAAGVDQAASDTQGGGNMEGKELRFGVAASGLWAVATTAASNGSVNAMHDSFTPLGGLWPLWMMQLSEVIFGGVGSGLYGLLAYAVVAVFVAGLMVGPRRSTSARSSRSTR